MTTHVSSVAGVASIVRDSLLPMGEVGMESSGSGEINNLPFEGSGNGCQHLSVFTSQKFRAS